ncbi:MAG TPA: hypothetical protein ENN80_05665, partial [Candidatus Hydrogenedentes bacterium]|nr:hypothetical protein [Candidatus Hydrogenedentota bacterium]
MKRMCWMVTTVAVALVAMPGTGWSLTLDEETCLILANPSDPENPGFDDQGYLLALILGLLGGEIDLPIPTDWFQWDFEYFDPTFEEMGDGIPDNYQMALLAAVLCSEEESDLLNLIRQQYEDNLVAYGSILDSLTYIADNASLIIDLLEEVGAGLAAIPEIQNLVINWPEPGDTLGEFAEDLVDLAATLGDYESLLPLIVNVFNVVGPWFAGMGGLSSEMQMQLQSLLGLLDEYLGQLYDLVDLMQNLVATYGPSGTGLISADLADAMLNLADLAAGFSLEIPVFAIYGVSGDEKTPSEPMSARGDWNHDGFSNLYVYNVVQAAGGTRADFVYEATKEALHVISPNGGEVWDVDTPQVITWNPLIETTGAFVRIGLHRGPSFWGWLALKTENDGAFNW